MSYNVSLFVLYYHKIIADGPIYSVVTASAIQIGYIQALSTYTDLLHSIWRIVVCGQVAQVTSIMTATIPFLKPFLTSLESGFLSANNASHTTVSIHQSTRKTGHPLSYIRLGSQLSRDPFERRDKQDDIWVRMDVVVKRELESNVGQGKGNNTIE